MKKNYLILSQYRDESGYNDFIGILYHFPKKHKNFIQKGSEFVYYEPSKKGKGVYFGYGKIGDVFEDKKESDHYYAKIIDYKPFINEVSLKQEDGALFENPDQYNPQNAARYSTHDILEHICQKGGVSKLINFKTRARTVDMLGRQQIAGIPTAINELFKNAHDAYANDAIVDYYVSDGLFVLRDNGLGMTLDDFINRWLTLGTDSKVNSSGASSLPPVDPTKEERPSMGEKGIGRLSISIIGSQVLILTRAKRFDENNKESYHELVAAFINWKMFEIPGINIDEISIPIKTFSSGVLPNEVDVSNMVQEVRENLEQLDEKVPEDMFEAISSELNKFKIDPSKEANFLKEPDLINGSGTHFYILPSDPIIKEDLNTEDTSYSKLHKHLLGFTDTMTPDHEPPKIKAGFKWHNRTDDLSIDIIDEDSFFTPDDFLNADHRFDGEFDEYGAFHGQVTMYGKEPVEYHLPWPFASGKKISCGAFKLSFSAIQGLASETSMPIDKYTTLNAKCAQIGGLYIYKNGIRVLPYGDNDFDFLEIEKRRNLSLRNYFSYRKMFGAIKINHIENKNLKEKAGREGFQDNNAYRQFRDILIHFLKKVAEDFTQDDGIYSKIYTKEKEVLKKADKRKKQQEKKKKENLKDFLSKFKSAFEKMQSLKHVSETETLQKELDITIANTLSFNDAEEAAYRIINIEKEYFNRFKEIEKSYTIARPQGVTIKKKQDNELFLAYKAELEHAVEKVFNPAREKLALTISTTIQDARLQVDRRKRIETSLFDIFDETKKESNHEKRIVLKENNEVEESVKKATRDSMKVIEETIREVTDDFNSTDFSGMSEEEIAKKRMIYEETIESVAQREKKTLETIRILLSGVEWDFDEEGNIISDLDIQEANERALTEVQEQHKLDMELAQIGVAINIINHEFDSSIRTVRRTLRRLKAWADVNENIAEIYNDVRGGFEHIDGYLSLFTPLNRRLYREKIDIRGYEIVDFIDNLFKVRFERHEINFKVTDSFRKHSEKGYPSTFYPVFINLVDNSIYWLKGLLIKDKTITFDTLDGNFIITDNGPGIRDEIRSNMFDLGYSTKPGGRGMGLYIAKQSLNELGFDISLLDSEKGATFMIATKKDEDNE